MGESVYSAYLPDVCSLSNSLKMSMASATLIWTQKCPGQISHVINYTTIVIYVSVVNLVSKIQSNKITNK